MAADGLGECSSSLYCGFLEPGVHNSKEKWSVAFNSELIYSYYFLEGAFILNGPDAGHSIHGPPSNPMASLDIESAYLHVPIADEFKKLFLFCMDNRV